MTKEVIIDLRSWYANTLLTTFITASATPIARSSYHEILVCRWLVGCDSYCYRCDGKWEFKELTSYQHGVVSIIWLIMTELRTHWWMDRMIQMHICTERGLRESSWGRSWWEECVLENGEWISKMSDFVIDEDVQIVCWAKWRELSHTHVIGVWSKWAGMIVCDDIEMKGREKEWFLEWMGWWWVWSTVS